MTLRGKLIDETENIYTIDFYWNSSLEKIEEIIEEFLEDWNVSNINIDYFEGNIRELEIDEINYDKTSNIIRVKCYKEV